MGEQRRAVFDAVRPWLDQSGFTPARISALDVVLDRAGLPRDAAEPAPAAGAPLAWPVMLERLTNRAAPAATDAEFASAAALLGHGVTAKHIKASRIVEAPRGAFDDQARPTILFERHVFARNTNPKGRFNAAHPDISGPAYGAGGYGSFASQWGKLERAYALDPEAAFEACSWGAFQVLGENAIELGYPSARAMALSLAQSEAAHLESYVRFISHHGLADELAACRAGDPGSCIAFVERYNGGGFRQFGYHIKFAEALR